MSALARYFLGRGAEVYGYDLTATRLTRKLEAEGMTIHYVDDPLQIPKGIDLVVITPAIPESHKEWDWFRKNELPIKKRAEVLGMISRNHKTIAVAGTHGKTSTSSMIAHLLTYCGLDVSAFLGGILSSYDTNYLDGKSDYVVLEADEYDRSFLQLNPDVLVILSMDADHLDIYGNHANMIMAYEELTLRIAPNGKLILMSDLEDYFSYGWRAKIEARNIDLIQLGENFSYSDVRIEDSRFWFDYTENLEELKGLVSNMPGAHNILNASAAIYISRSLGVSNDKIREALLKFKGIKRRFEFLHTGRVHLIDDYAHHPKELKSAIDTILSLYPDRHVLGIFQPHLFSRTKDFYEGFAEELSRLGEVWLLDVYPAREKPIEGVGSELIYNLVRNDNKRLIKAKDLNKTFENNIEGLDVVITLGAADLDKYHPRMIEMIKESEFGKNI